MLWFWGVGSYCHPAWLHMRIQPIWHAFPWNRFPHKNAHPSGHVTSLRLMSCLPPFWKRRFTLVRPSYTFSSMPLLTCPLSTRSTFQRPLSTRHGTVHCRAFLSESRHTFSIQRPPPWVTTFGHCPAPRHSRRSSSLQVPARLFQCLLASACSGICNHYSLMLYAGEMIEEPGEAEGKRSAPLLKQNSRCQNYSRCRCDGEKSAGKIHQHFNLSSGLDPGKRFGRVSHSKEPTYMKSHKLLWKICNNS